jgi:chromosome segregation ATPase
MIKKKLVAVITAATILLGGATTTAFAANGDFKEDVKTVKESIKKNVESLKGKKGSVIKAVDNKKAEMGLVKVDKASVAAELELLKGLKTDLQKLHEEFKTAKQAKDKEKMAALKPQITDKLEQVNKAVQELAPFKVQVKSNKEIRKQIQPLKEEVKAMWEQRQTIRKENETIKADVKTLRGQLKEAVENNKEEDVTSITGKILEKLNLLNDNLTKLNNLKDDAVNTVNSWKS